MTVPRVLDALATAKRTLAIAESFTGGRLLDAWTNVSGASRVVLGGIVAYEDDAKRRLLDVPDSTIRTYGAASLETALAMAAGVQKRFGADYGLATTGIAGPTGATAAKPLGLSCVAATGALDSRTDLRIHGGDRDGVKAAAAAQATAVLADLLRAQGIL